MSNFKEYDFMKIRLPMIIMSMSLVVISLISLAIQGLNLGLDFTGGTVIELEYSKPPVIADVRQKLADKGFTNVVVQKFGTDTSILLRMQQEGETVGQQVLDALKADGNDIQLKRSEYVGAQVGGELREKGGLAMLLALGGILIYVAMRFQFKWALGAVLALAHDVIVTLGAFSIFRWDFDLTVLGAVLAVIGYSLNDSIVVFDRIRENFRKLRKGTSVQIINVSLTQTLARTLATSGTTFAVTLALFLFGGEAIHNFSLALLIGVGFGTYSSIYVATVLALMLGASREDFMLPVKEGAEVDTTP